MMIAIEMVVVDAAVSAYSEKEASLCGGDDGDCLAVDQTCHMSLVSSRGK